MTKFVFNVVLFLAASGLLGACQADSNERMIGVSLTGIDQLPAQYSIQEFSVNGTNGAQAGRGGSKVCCVSLPAHWHPNLTVKVEWAVTDWPHRRYSRYERIVPVEKYPELDDMHVHFLPDGSVRVIATSAPGLYEPNADYPGPQPLSSLQKKQPWADFAPAPGAPEFKLVPDVMAGDNT